MPIFCFGQRALGIVEKPLTEDGVVCGCTG
jgi:hypothetical protein